MKSHNYQTEHFKMMSELSDTLKSEILEHHYHPESFGSWWFTFEKARNKFRIVFDGRDRNLSLEQKIILTDSKHEWKFIEGKHLPKLDSDYLVSEVCFLVAIK